jgi:hypothetical protein
MRATCWDGAEDDVRRLIGSASPPSADGYRRCGSGDLVWRRERATGKDDNLQICAVDAKADLKHSQ